MVNFLKYLYVEKQMNKLRRIAIYLPQFHPIPENDEWWGKGFTEWTNVTKAQPRFKEHYQPHLPSELGFYDLRLSESRLAQEALAKEHDIYGFCYYHYWFNGKRLLNEPLDRKLVNEKEDLPFMLCWANENWTRAWDGTDQQILIKQNYSEQDDRAHIKHLIQCFKDPRYIKVNGKPVFIFYKPDLLPDVRRTVEIFREEASMEGLELYLCWFERWIGWQGAGYESTGLDAAIEFQPLSKSLQSYLKTIKLNSAPKSVFNQRLLKLKSRIYKKLKLTLPLNDLVIDYRAFVDFDLSKDRKKLTYKCFPCVCPMWDNSSRRVNQNAIIFKGSNPDIFRKWITEMSNNFTPYSDQENLIFINAWNEWAEGNHLEPCQKWGRKYLEALK